MSWTEPSLLIVAERKYAEGIHGGARSHLRTRLCENSLLTGKIQGILRFSAAELLTPSSRFAGFLPHTAILLPDRNSERSGKEQRLC